MRPPIQRLVILVICAALATTSVATKVAEVQKPVSDGALEAQTSGLGGGLEAPTPLGAKTHATKLGAKGRESERRSDSGRSEIERRPGPQVWSKPDAPSDTQTAGGPKQPTNSQVYQLLTSLLAKLQTHLHKAIGSGQPLFAKTGGENPLAALAALNTPGVLNPVGEPLEATAGGPVPGIVESVSEPPKPVLPEGKCNDHVGCEEGEYCLNDDEQQPVFVGTCTKQPAGFCFDNSNCDDSKYCELVDSEVAYGVCTPKVPARLVSKPSPVDKNGPKAHSHLNTPIGLPNVRMAAEGAGTMEMEELSRPEVVDIVPLADEIVEAMPVPTFSREHKHCHTETHEEMKEKLGVVNDIEEKETVVSRSFLRHAEDNKSLCEESSWKTCGFDAPNLAFNCDDPLVRDSDKFKTDSKKKLFLGLKFHRSHAAGFSTVAKNDYAYKLSAQINTLNQDYAQANIQFTARLFWWENDELAKKRVKKTACTGEDVNCISLEHYIQGLKANAQEDMFKASFNVFLVEFLVPDLLGFAFFPWDIKSEDIGSGTLAINLNHINGKEKSLSHELGHSVGLYHTFRGTAEEKCKVCTGDDTKPDCYERNASDVAGDLCADTAPTPKHYECKEPGGHDECTKAEYGFTPFANIMSYGSDACITNFTENQIRRMRCWIMAGVKTRTFFQEKCLLPVPGKEDVSPVVEDWVECPLEV